MLFLNKAGLLTYPNESKTFSPKLIFVSINLSKYMEIIT